MLNGIDPIIIFNFKKASFLSEALSKIPLVSDVISTTDLPAIPIYLSESLTGICIDTEDKSIEVDTNIDTVTNGDTPVINQKAISNTVKIGMTANRDSIGVMLFAALTDLVFPKLTSKEYSITYLHGAVTVFGGMLHSFSITQNAENTLYTISLELVKPGGPKGPQIPIVGKIAGAVPL
jgi:hypothetical protein